MSSISFNGNWDVIMAPRGIHFFHEYFTLFPIFPKTDFWRKKMATIFVFTHFDSRSNERQPENRPEKRERLDKLKLVAFFSGELANPTLIN